MGLDYTAYISLWALDEWQTVMQQLSIELCHHAGWLDQLGSGSQSEGVHCALYSSLDPSLQTNINFQECTRTRPCLK